MTAVDLLSEQQRRVYRSRQIVARQRELVAKYGDRLPVAVALLETFERMRELFERMLDRSEPPAVRAEQPAQPKSVEAAVVTEEMTHEGQMREVARIMEILRSGGYHCEPAEDAGVSGWGLTRQ